MPKTELVQAELAVIEAGLSLAKLKVMAVEAKVEEVKASLELVRTVSHEASRVLAIEAEVNAVRERLLMIEAGVKLFRCEDDQASFNVEDKTSSLRARIELNNDKLSVIARELNQIDQDIRYPRFTVAGLR